MINRERIYTGGLKHVQDPIVVKKDDNRSLKFFESFVSHEIQICTSAGRNVFWVNVGL